MAIKVVQGLINVRSGSASLGSTKVSATLDDRSKTATRSLQTLTSQQIATISTSASQVKGATDAALSVVRARGPGREGVIVRDAKEAQAVADAIADRVGAGEDRRTDVHSRLSALSARQHF